MAAPCRTTDCERHRVGHVAVEASFRGVHGGGSFNPGCGVNEFGGEGQAEWGMNQGGQAVCAESPLPRCLRCAAHLRGSLGALHGVQPDALDPQHARVQLNTHHRRCRLGGRQQ